MMSGELDLGRRLRDAGIRRASQGDTAQALLRVARDWAESYARKHGTVSINDVRRVLDLSAMRPNSIGGIFRDSRFTICGYTQAEHANAHARTIKIYTLKNKD